jgi:ferredoxin-type protein NapG
MTETKAVAKPRKKKLNRKQQQRRTLLVSALAGVGVTGTGLAGVLPVKSVEETRLRPPGALEADLFLASCIKCGQCVQVCPVEAIVLGDILDGFGIGVPYIDARTQACDFSCDATQCVLACPTGSLSHDVDKKEQVEMGMARLTRPKACLAVQGKGFSGLARGADFEGTHRYLEVDRWNPIPIADHPYELEICDLCVRECPIKNAISLEAIGDDPDDLRKIPVVNEQVCVGCGMCEMICPVEPTAIEIEIGTKREEVA